MMNVENQVKRICFLLRLVTVVSRNVYTQLRNRTFTRAFTSCLPNGQGEKTIVQRTICIKTSIFY